MNTPQRGFTLVELVVVMVLMAVLASVAAARFSSREPFAAQSLADQLTSSLRLAQASAVARRAPVHVSLVDTPASLSVCLDAACTSPIPPTGGAAGEAWLVEAEGLTLSRSADFSFGADGTPSLAATLELQVRAGGGVNSRTVRVEVGSGHVHQR